MRLSHTKWFTCILFTIISHIKTAHALDISSTLFISSDGIDFDDCGSQLDPCGTIGFASALAIHHSSYANTHKIDLYITGQNEQEISLWQTNKKYSNISFIHQLQNSSHYFGDGWSVCVLYANYNKSVELTFDPQHIQSMTDWYPDICDHPSNTNAYLFWFYAETDGNSIVFNNLIINDFTLRYDIRTLMFITDTVSLELNNCSFYSINKVYFSNIENWHYLITASNITITNTIFRDITISGDPYYESAFLRIASGTTSDISLYIDNCTVINYQNTGGSFLFVDAQNFYSNVRSLSVSNSHFSDITTSSSLILSTSYFGSWKVEIDIEQCAFLNINLGSILVTQNGHIINMENITITTKQLVHDLLQTDESYLISLFAFSGGDEVTINNIHLQYIYDLQSNCEKQSDTNYGHISYYYISCYAPIQLIQNIGILDINNLTVSNDIRYYKVQNYFANNGYECGIGADHLFTIRELCEFVYTSGIDYSLIYNEGELTLNNFFIHGTGLHFMLIRNKGNTFLNNAITKYQYYYNQSVTCSADNAYCGYDAYTLNTAVYFRNDGNNICGGQMVINNSYIYGAQFQSIYLTGGTNYIHNTQIEQSRAAISASPDVSYLFIDNVKFVNVGTYYISWAAIAQSIGYPPALMLSAKQSVIQNSHFSFYDPWGFIFVSPRAWSIFFASTLDSDVDEYEMILMNNTFELSTDSYVATMQDVIALKPLFQSTIDRYKESLSEALHLFLDEFDGAGLFYTDGLLLFDQLSVMRMIGNKFNGNDLSPEVAFISINNSYHLNCMSGNTVYGYALNLISGIVTSCHRDTLTDIINKTEHKCWNGGLGHLYTSYLERIDDAIDAFIATDANIHNNIALLSIRSSQSVFAAEKVSFAMNASMETTYNAIDFLAGHILMFDAIFSPHIDIAYDTQCDIHCFQLVNNSNISSIAHLTVSQIYGSCVSLSNQSSSDLSSLLSDAHLSYVSHWSAASIQLTSTQEYYAGGKLYINYTILDSFGNIITDYEESIHIQFSSEILNLQLIVIVDSDGFCSICEHGIYIQTISIDHVGHNFTIYTAIDNDELTVNDMTFSVVVCPSGFGRSGAAKQCEICTNGYFSLYPTINECVQCTEYDFDLEAISCDGANTISVDYNYWIAMDDNYSMIAGLCPPFRCCQDRNSCDYFQNQASVTKDDDANVLCSSGRDPSSYLCSACLAGYTELIASVSCGICERDYIERLIYPFLLAALITFSVVFTTSSKVAEKHATQYDSVVVIQQLESDQATEAKQEHAPQKKKIKMKGFFIVFTIMIFNPIAYYFQAISYIITHSQGLSLSIYLASFVELFNFSLDTTSSEGAGFCFLSNMNALDKILWSLSISLFSLCVLVIFYALTLCNISKICCCCCTNNREPRYWRAFISILLLCFGNVLSVIFKILSCKHVGDGLSVHFYFAYQECYGASWWVALVFFSIIIILFITFFMKLYKMDEELRQSDDSYFRTLTRSYHAHCWFYEGFILFRRTLFALFTVSSFANQMYADFIIMLFLIFCLIVNTKLSPFLHPYINYMEAFCLSLTMLMVFIKEDDAFTEYVTGILIVLPIVLLLIFALLYCRFPKHAFQGFDTVKQLNSSYLHVPTESHQITPPTRTTNAVLMELATYQTNKMNEFPDTTDMNGKHQEECYN